MKKWYKAQVHVEGLSIRTNVYFKTRQLSNGFVKFDNPTSRTSVLDKKTLNQAEGKIQHIFYLNSVSPWRPNFKLQ